MLNHITRLLRFGDDSADEQEVYANIVSGVDFRGAKLWILVIAVFVASLGLNTNSAAVIIGAMLISPLMGPIIGMGLGAGTYDFELLGRSWRNYIVATIFSILTATFYFLITPVADAQSELLARTSPTIYDVLIALGGGLAGIIALGSRSQRTGNVIPGVAIATALMPPLCTVGFGIATANWSYAAGALYLFLINTIFIAFATLVGVVFIMKFRKKTFIDEEKAKRVKRVIYAIVVVTMVPALFLTVGMVRENY
ncbi:MAG: TIGR00341 family protein, partial [Bacteroidaceae bacterium]